MKEGNPIEDDVYASERLVERSPDLEQHDTKRRAEDFLRSETGILAPLAEAAKTKAGKIARVLLATSYLFVSAGDTVRTAEFHTLPQQMESIDTAAVSGRSSSSQKVENATSASVENIVKNPLMQEFLLYTGGRDKNALSQAIQVNPWASKWLHLEDPRTAERLYPEALGINSQITIADIKKDIEDIELMATAVETSKEVQDAISFPGKLITEKSLQEIRPSSKSLQEIQSSFSEKMHFINEYFKSATERNYVEERGLVTIPENDFENIFLSLTNMGEFKDYAKKSSLSFANAFSLVHAVYRDIASRMQKITEQTIVESVTKILDTMAETENLEIFGHDTQLIVFTHEGQQNQEFDPKALENIFIHAGGKKENILVSVNGMRMQNGKNINKQVVLDALADSSGHTTLIFYGHGSPSAWAFSENKPDNLILDTASTESAISYKELGDALIASGNIENITLVGDTCFAYDFFENLDTYLAQKTNKRPRVTVSAANLHRYGLNYPTKSVLFDMLNNVVLDGQPITLRSIRKAEKDMWQYQNPAIRVNMDMVHTTNPDVAKDRRGMLELGWAADDSYAWKKEMLA